VDEALSEFLRENIQGLTQMDVDLNSLQEKGNAAATEDPELYGRLYRAMHTIAGTAGFLGFDKLGAIGAASELLIASLREGDFELKPNMIDAIRSAVGKARDILENVKETEQEGDVDCSEIITTLKTIQKEEGGVVIEEPDAQMVWLD